MVLMKMIKVSVETVPNNVKPVKEPQLIVLLVLIKLETHQKNVHVLMELMMLVKKDVHLVTPNVKLVKMDSIVLNVSEENKEE